MPKTREDELKDAKELESFHKTAAGQIIIKALDQETREIMFRFVAELNDPQLNRYIALSSELKEKLELIRKFTKAGDLRQVIENSPIEEEPTF